MTYEIRKNGRTVDRVATQADSWIVADYIQEFYPDSTVTLVEVK